MMLGPDNILEYVEETKKLSILEQDETQISISTDDGGTSEEALRGYHRACSVFLEINQENLNRSQKEELKKAIRILAKLNQEAKIIHDNQLIIAEGLVLTDIDNESEVRTRIDELAEEQYEQLMLEEEKYINYGYAASLVKDDSQPLGYRGESGHAEIMKLRFEGNQETGIGQYFVNIYNAGDGTEFVNKNKSSVKAIRYYKANFQSKDEAINFIKLCNERNLTGAKGITAKKFVEINDVINQLIKELPYHSSEKAQTRGNCTTRSIRESLKEILSPELFSELYGFVSNRPILEQNIGEYLITQEQRRSSPTSYNPRKILFQTKIREGGTNLPEVTEDLISEQFTYNNNEKGTLLHYAVAKGNESLFDILVTKYNMDGTERNQAGYSVLEYAINKRYRDASSAFIENLSSTGRKDKLEELNIYGRTPILSAIETDQLDIIHLLVEAKVDLSALKNNNYLIIKRLGEKVISSDKELASGYLDLMTKILETYSVKELDIEAKDLNKKDLLDIAQKIIRAQRSELPEKSREFLVNLYKKDMESESPVYTEINTRMLASLKMMKHEDIKRFPRNLVIKNPNFFLKRVDLELCKAKENKTSSLEYLADMGISELNKELFEILIISINSQKCKAESLDLKEETLQKLVHNLSYDASEQENIRRIFVELFDDNVANNLLDKINFTEQHQSPKLNQDKMVEEADNIDDYLDELDRDIEDIKARGYQFGDFTRGLLNSFGLQNISNAIGLGEVREDAPSASEMIYSAAMGASSYIGGLWGSSVPAEVEQDFATPKDGMPDILKEDLEVKRVIESLKDSRKSEYTEVKDLNRVSKTRPMKRVGHNH